ncbi:MAG: hypothetical protein GXP63_06540 [DPANN group archaeon]|nr:hypothetical protein [DPANN group archaeon]
MKRFAAHLKKGAMRKSSPDFSRARSLMQEAEKRKTFLDIILRKTGVSELNANYCIEQAYDVLIELIRAILHMEGYNSPDGASHEAEVSYLLELQFSYADAVFMDDLRYHQDQIKRHGRSYDVEYATKALTFLKNMHRRLKMIISTRI